MAKNETGIPDQLKADIEKFSRFSMNDVRVYYNSDKPATRPLSTRKALTSTYTRTGTLTAA